jgi:hypothetical protein
LSKDSNVMRTALLVILVFHILSGVFWAGSTFALARTGGASADRLFRPQMGAAVVAVITGALLWYLLHASGFGPQERVLALGALAAVAAACIQGAWCGAALHQLASTAGYNARSQGRITLGHQIAAALLALTVICMAAARYV